jgi:hypothetical protein
VATRFRIQSFFVSSVLPSFALLSATFGCAQEKDGDTGGTIAPATMTAQPTATDTTTMATGTGTGTSLPPSVPSEMPTASSPGTGTALPVASMTMTAMPTASETAPAASGTDAPASSGTGTDADAGAPPVSAEGTYNPDFKEFYGDDCTVSEPAEVNNPKLPDLFEFFDGTRMSKKSDWKCRLEVPPGRVEEGRRDVHPRREARPPRDGDG